MTRIVIRLGDDEFQGHLTDEFAPRTVQKIIEALPFESQARCWGDEIYFDIPVQMEEENARTKVSVGDLGYWPQGACFCIFYGMTPMSRSEDEIIPASPVNLIGRIEDPESLKQHAAAGTVIVSLAP